MIPVLQRGDQVYINKFIYRYPLQMPNRPSHGHLVLYVYPRNPHKKFIKRIIGSPGDTVQLCNAQVSINGQPLRRERLLGPCKYDDYDHGRSVGTKYQVNCVAYREWNGTDNYITVHSEASLNPSRCTEWKVPGGHVFVMGDNRDDSDDSLSWDLVPYQDIKGKAWFIGWSEAENSIIQINRIFSLIH